MIYDGKKVRTEEPHPRARRTGPHLEKTYPGDFLAGYQSRESYRERTLHALTDLADKIEYQNAELDAMERHLQKIRSEVVNIVALMALHTGILIGILINVLK